MAIDSRHATKLIVSVVILWAIAVTSFILRAIAIRIRKRAWKSHDYLTALALLCSTGYTVDVIVGAVAGAYGADVTTISLDKLIISLKVFFASEWFFVTAVAAFRLAIICLYLELFRVAWFCRCAIVTIVIVVLYWIASLLTITLLCRPINSNWNPTVKGTCGDVAKTEYASAGFNLAVDLLVVTLPMPIVWRLQMAEKKKISVTAAFLLGLITAGINVGRITQTTLCDPSNTTYCALDASILVAAEISSGILVSCVPTLGPVLFGKRTRAYIERSSRKVRTIGSSGRRNWRKRQLQSSTLLNSHDDEVELGESETPMGVSITSPSSCYFGDTDNPRTGKSSAGIIVINETSVLESAASMGRQQGGIRPYAF